MSIESEIPSWVAERAKAMRTSLSRPTLKPDGTVDVGIGSFTQKSMADALNGVAEKHPVSAEILNGLQANQDFISIKAEINKDAGTWLTKDGLNKFSYEVYQAKQKALGLGSLWSSVSTESSTTSPNSDETPRLAKAEGIGGYIMSFIYQIVDYFRPHSVENTMLANANKVAVEATNNLIKDGMSGPTAILVADKLTREAMKVQGGDVTVTPIMKAALAAQKDRAAPPPGTLIPQPGAPAIAPHLEPSEVLVSSSITNLPDPRNRERVINAINVAALPYADPLLMAAF